VKLNTSEGVKPLPLIGRQELEIEIAKEPVPKIPLLIKMALGENLYEDDQTTQDNSLVYDEFEFSYDEYIEIFNELMCPGRATHSFDDLPKTFNNSNTFKQRAFHSNLGIFKPESGKRRVRLISTNFNPKNLRSNPFRWGRLTHIKSA